MSFLRNVYESCLRGPWRTAGENVQYRVEREGTSLYLYFQQTASASDWRANFDCPAVAYKRSPVPWMAHRGFLRLWKSAQADVFTSIMQSGVESPIRFICVSGFSQGAALATLAYEDIKYGLSIDVAGIVFGSPRVLWMPPLIVKHRFADLSRYEVRGDLVTMVPPWALGYQHVGRVHRIGDWCPPCPWRHDPEWYREDL